MLVYTHTKLGKDSTQGDVHFQRATRASDTYRERGTEQGQIAEIHQFMRIARVGYGVYGCSLILFARMVITEGGLKAFAWTTNRRALAESSVARLIMFPKTQGRNTASGVRSAPTITGVESCRLHVDVGTGGKSHTVYTYRGLRDLRLNMVTLTSYHICGSTRD